jgi:tetratricopeptide (TPR) repeat protein
MRRTLLWLLIVATALVLALALVVTLRSLGGDELPAPDARLPIQLADGTWVPLADALAQLEAAREPPAAQPLLADATSGPAAAATTAASYPGMPWGPVFKLAEHHRQAGRRDQALALFQSIPDSDPDHALACRRIAREVVARGDPAGALPFAHAALRAEPFDLNSWQDLARVYGAGLGLPVGSD